MATDKRTVEHLLEQAAGAGDVSARPMFGEYGLYLGGKLVGLICDDRLFVKPTPGGRALAGAMEDAAPYPGAKPQMVVEADRWDDADWLAGLLRITAVELPAPKPKKPRA